MGRYMWYALKKKRWGWGAAVAAHTHTHIHTLAARNDRVCGWGTAAAVSYSPHESLIVCLGAGKCLRERLRYAVALGEL